MFLGVATRRGNSEVRIAVTQAADSASGALQYTVNQ